MITCRELAYFNPSPPEPGRKLFVGPTDLRDPGGRGFIARWQAHVDAGRISKGEGLSDETRETILANERLMFGRQRTIID